MRGVGVGIQLPMPPPMQGSPVKPGNLLTAQEEPCGLAMATPPPDIVPGPPVSTPPHDTRRWGETPLPHANRHCLDWVT